MLAASAEASMASGVRREPVSRSSALAARVAMVAVPVMAMRHSRHVPVGVEGGGDRHTDHGAPGRGVHAFEVGRARVREPAAGTVTAVSSSPRLSAVRLLPRPSPSMVKNSLAGKALSPSRLRRCTVAPTARTTGGQSPCGSASASEPPSVARLRMSGSLITAAAAWKQRRDAGDVG